MSRIYVDRISPYQSGSLTIDGFSPAIDTGSFATTGSNTFQGNQTINGNLITSQDSTINFGYNTNGLTLTSYDGLDVPAFGGAAVDTSFGIQSNGFLSNNQSPLQFSIGIGVGTLGGQQAQSGSLIFESLALGYGALGRIQAGNRNVAVAGRDTLRFLSTGSNNVTLGNRSLEALGLNQGTTPQDNNIAIGNEAGRNSVQTGLLNAGNNNIFIGNVATALSASADYEIVIGSFAQGNGNNTTTIGSVNQTQATYLLGDTQIVANNGTSGSLEVQGSVQVNQTLKLIPQDPLPAGVLGELAVSGSNLYFYDGSSWVQK